ncbi:MAG: hypothetical protein R3B70_39575, partial [Polyangiaceae bacterium]
SSGSDAPSSPVRSLGYGLFIGGAATLIAGGVTGGIALDSSDASKRLCPGDVCKTQEGMDLNAQARSAALAANILFPAGLALMGAGVITVLLAPRSGKTNAAVAPWVSPWGGGLGLTGRF